MQSLLSVFCPFYISPSDFFRRRFLKLLISLARSEQAVPLQYNVVLSRCFPQVKLALLQQAFVSKLSTGNWSPILSRLKTTGDAVNHDKRKPKVNLRSQYTCPSQGSKTFPVWCDILTEVAGDVRFHSTILPAKCISSCCGKTWEAQ